MKGSSELLTGQREIKLWRKPTESVLRPQRTTGGVFHICLTPRVCVGKAAGTSRSPSPLPVSLWREKGLPHSSLCARLQQNRATPAPSGDSEIYNRLRERELVFLTADGCSVREAAAQNRSRWAAQVRRPAAPLWLQPVQTGENA